MEDSPICGIVGVFSLKGIGVNSRDFFEDALYCDALRGVDSTGVYMYSNRKKTENKVIKKPLHALDFLWNKRFQTQLNKVINYNCLIGHNRSATRGEINTENSHPFQDGNICMVHNGTLSDKTNLIDHSKYSVDSRAICHSINEIGIDETTKLLKGSYALVWIDHREKTLNFVRNSQRPMHFAYSEKEQALYWASEGGMLRWLMDRNKITDGEVLTLRADRLISYSLDSSSMEFTSRDVETFSYPKYQGYSKQRNTHHHHQKNKTTKLLKNGTTQTLEKKTIQSGLNKTIKSGPTTSLPTTAKTQTQDSNSVVDINDHRKAPEYFPKIGDTLQVYVYDRMPIPSCNSWNAFGYSYDSVGTVCEFHNIKKASICSHEGIYEAKVVNVTYRRSTGCHVALCVINHAVELDERSFDEMEIEEEKKDGAVPFKKKSTALCKIEETPHYTADQKSNFNRLLEDWNKDCKDLALENSKKSLVSDEENTEVIFKDSNESNYEMCTFEHLDEGEYEHRILGPNNTFIPICEFNSLVSNGCSCCSKDLTGLDATTIYWVEKSGSFPICKECCADEQVQIDIGLDIPHDVVLAAKRRIA